MPNSVPHLCGGTFFVLLTEAKGRTKTHRQLLHGPDKINNKNMLESLIKVFKPSFSQPSRGKTFDGDTSDYKACKVSYSSNLPFDEEVLIDNFDKRVKTEYASLLGEMRTFVYSFLDCEDDTKMKWLTKALVEIIEKDDSIPAGTKLYVYESGVAATKLSLSTETEYNLPALLLGIWHFIVTERKDNESGRDTFEAWHIPPRESNSKWKFNSAIGKLYPREVTYTIESSDEKTGSTTDMKSAIEPEGFGERKDNGATESEDSERTENTIVNNGTIIQQHANSIINIDHLDVLNL